MKMIPLTRGKIAIVDDRDFKLVSSFEWFASCNRSGNWYARRNETMDCAYASMHALILNSFKEIDHKDRDGLNNRRDNLRIVTRKQNSYNRVGRAGKRYKGVSWMAIRNKWRAYIVSEGKQISLGLHQSKKLAMDAYDKKAIELWGEYARTNHDLQKNRRGKHR